MHVYMQYMYMYVFRIYIYVCMYMRIYICIVIIIIITIIIIHRTHRYLGAPRMLAWLQVPAPAPPTEPPTRQSSLAAAEGFALYFEAHGSYNWCYEYR